MTHITRLLDGAAQGDGIAAEQLLRMVYTAQRRVPREDGPVPDDRWTDWIYARTLILEAKTLIQPESANAPTNPK